MIVRTYGRRNRGMPRTFADSFDDDDDDDTFSLPPENNPGNHLSQDIYNFPFSSSSQDSSSHWPSFDPDPYAFNSSQEPAFPSSGVVSRKPKKPRNDTALVPLTSTLMEAQEFGEMMEHVDEVNFALDGLKKGQPVRIRRASLSSLLSICGTASQRRLLRTQGLAKTIIDAILGLSFDDSSSNLAAATLFYVLTSDGLDDQLLESPSSIHFLIKLLKPVTSTATENKARNIGSKLLALRKDADILRDVSKAPDSNSTAILAKVQEILVSCKDVKLHDVSNSGAERPELHPKWIALLAMEKACLSKISFEDTTGSVRKTGGNFKEKFRELGGLDTVFEVAMNCHSVMESWLERCSPSQDSPSQDAKDGVNLQSLVLLLKCLKIMENATFLSKDNQSHLLAMRGTLDSHGCRLSFIKLIIRVIKILSGLHLLQLSFNSNGGKQCNPLDGSGHGSDLALATDFKDKIEVISISSSSDHSEDRNSIAKSFNASQKPTDQFSQFASTSDTSTTLTQDTLKMRIHSSMSSSCSDSLRSSSNGSLRSSSNGSRNNFGLLGNPSYSKEPACQLLVDSQDPFAFDEDEFQPSKWDLLYGKKKPSRTRKISVIGKRPENEYNYQLMSQEESSHDTIYQQKSSNGEHHSLQKNDCCSNASSEEYSSLLGDCLLTAVKVLMNLTNDNPIGCQQIAACGGLEIISSLIADHFPSFGASLSLFSEMKEDTSGVELQRQNDIRLADHELDFLVAILGLLVNLVEKDEQNRSRLAAATVSLPNSEGSQEESHKDVIPLLCSIFLANQGAGDASGEADIESWNDEAALLQGEKEAEKMILEAYAALLLAFLSTESKNTREIIADHLPDRKLAILVPVLERFVAFHLTLNMISSETHKAVSEVIESCRMA